MILDNDQADAYLMIKKEMLNKFGDHTEPKDLPEHTNIKIVDGLFIKTWTVPDDNTMLTQHSHSYDHVSIIASGGVLIWVDDKPLGMFLAPETIFIKANAKHKFLTVTNNVTIICVHNVSRTGEIELEE